MYDTGLNPPPTKKKKTDQAQGGVGSAEGLPSWMATDVGDIQEDELQVYGRESGITTSRIASYTFEVSADALFLRRNKCSHIQYLFKVCDSLLNIGPCGNVSMGEPAFLSDEFSSTTKADPDVELVTTSGHGKNGALCVLQQTVRPQVVTTFELPGCRNMWTVRSGGGPAGASSADGHAFLILSRGDDSTMVLQTGQEINELEKSGFYTEGPTVYTGNMGGGKFIVQVRKTC